MFISKKLLKIFLLLPFLTACIEDVKFVENPDYVAPTPKPKNQPNYKWYIGDCVADARTVIFADGFTAYTGLIEYQESNCVAGDEKSSLYVDNNGVEQPWPIELYNENGTKSRATSLVRGWAQIYDGTSNPFIQPFMRVPNGLEYNGVFYNEVELNHQYIWNPYVEDDGTIDFRSFINWDK